MGGKMYPLGESNLSQLSALLSDTYEESDMPGGAKSGALADMMGPILQSSETRAESSLLDTIRLLTDMPADE